MKTKGIHYLALLLKQHLLTAIKGMSGDTFMFQRENGPAHQFASESVELLSYAYTQQISPYQWPPNSSDFDPVCYKTRGVMRERV